MFTFLSVLAVCATIVFVAVWQPTIRIELSNKQPELPKLTPVGDEQEPINENKNDLDALEAMMGDMVELFTGGDRVNETDNTTR